MISKPTLTILICRSLAAMLLILYAGSAAAQTEPPAPAQTYVDATGHALPYALDAQRIVSLAPNLTEMVYSSGLGDRLVGRTDFCNYPPEVLELPSVGGFVDTSLEKIIALRPDLVLASQGNSLELVEQLRQAGITVLAFREPSSVGDIMSQMSELWRVASAGSKPVSGSLNKLKLDFETYTSEDQSAGSADDATRPVVFFGYPGENTLTCGKGSFLDDVIRLAGGVNAAHDVDGRWPIVSAEFLVATDPDWILTATPCSGTNDIEEARAELLSELESDPVWSSLTAVKQGNVLVLNADILLRPGPRINSALDQLSHALSTEGSGGDVAQP